MNTENILKPVKTALSYISKPIDNAIGWYINKTANFCLKGVNKAIKYPKEAAMILVLTNVAKDAFACVFYVYQSITNEKIPEKKRKFVASLDLANGILMVINQYTLGKMLSSDRFGNFIDNVCGKSMNKGTISSLKIIIPLIGSAIIAKRVIVPFIATPTASWVKEKFMDKGIPKLAPNAVVFATPALNGLKSNNVVNLYNKIRVKDKVQLNSYNPALVGMTAVTTLKK